MFKTIQYKFWLWIIYPTQSKCCGNSVDQPNTSLTEIFYMTDNSEIPRDIEDATLHVIKKKIANSSNNSIEFKSDGPCARAFFSSFETEHSVNFLPRSFFYSQKILEDQSLSNFCRVQKKDHFPKMS